MRKRIIIFTEMVALMLAVTACGSDNDSPNDIANGNSEVGSAITADVDMNADMGVDVNTDVNTDTNESTSESTQFETTVIDPRIGKTLDELMDLTAYKEEAVSMDYYNDAGRELKDVLPFEIYQFFNGELRNYYADESGAKTVISEVIQGEFDTVMVIKMDGSDTYDLVKRATKTKYERYISCLYADLPDFVVIQTNITKEEVENMLYDNGILKEEYRPLLQGSAGASAIGQTLNEYMSSQVNAPKYYVVNPYDTYLEELTEYTMEYLLQNKIVLVYSGEYPMVVPGDEIAVVRTYFEDYVLGYTSIEEVIETINGYNVSAITTLPDAGNLMEFVNEYSGVNNITERSHALEDGKRLEEQIDLTAYNEILGELEATDDYRRELKDILPFEIYTVEHDIGLCNRDSVDGITKTVMSGAIPGEIYSVMIIKMDNASTYDILFRLPYEQNNAFYSCFFKDLGNYVVIASDITKAEVERMVNTDQRLYLQYEYLMQDALSKYDIVQ